MNVCTDITRTRQQHKDRHWMLCWTNQCDESASQYSIKPMLVDLRESISLVQLQSLPNHKLLFFVWPVTWWYVVLQNSSLRDAEHVVVRWQTRLHVTWTDAGASLQILQRDLDGPSGSPTPILSSRSLKDGHPESQSLPLGPRACG